MLKPEVSLKGDSEQLLMSFLTDLGFLRNLLVGLSREEINSNSGLLQAISKYLGSVQIQLTERLIFELTTNNDGSASDVSSGSVATHSMGNDIG